MSNKFTSPTEKAKSELQPVLTFFGVKSSGNLIKDLFSIRDEMNNEEKFLECVIKNMFQAYDLDGSGTIDKAELSLLLKDMINFLIPRFDQVKEKVSKEVKTALVPLVGMMEYFEQFNKEEIKNITSEIDSSFSEVKDLIKEEFSDIEAKFKEIDSDNNGKIDLKEFTDFFKLQFKESAKAIKDIENEIRNGTKEMMNEFDDTFIGLSLLINEKDLLNK